MLEVVGDLWEFHKAGEWIAITTNGDIRKDKTAVMGVGIALQAKQRVPGLAIDLGQLLLNQGNYPYAFRIHRLITFPVKHHWRDKADLKLIRLSAQGLVWFLDDGGFDPHPKSIYLPRPGCGHGWLSWDEVRPVIEPIFDDRFIVVNYVP